MEISFFPNPNAVMGEEKKKRVERDIWKGAGATNEASKRAVWRLWRRERRDWRRASEERSEETIHSPLFLSRPRDKTHSGARDVPWQRVGTTTTTNTTNDHQRPTPLQYLPLDVKIHTQHTQHPSSLLRVLYLLLVLFNADPFSFLFLAFFLPDPGAAPKVNAWEAPTDIPSWKEEHVSETHPTLLPHATCIFLLLSKT